jgi:two-component system KDP operon response regulator KdpE
MDEKEPKILIVDDEASIRHFLRVSLEGHKYKVLECDNGTDAIAVAQKENPDAMIVDMGLPDMTGAEVTEAVRKFSRAPIVILSVQGQEKTKIEALDLGADDYLTKPFSVDELLARLRAASRRFQATLNSTVLICGDVKLDLERRTVVVKGIDVSLTPNEFSLLAAMLRHAGKVLTHRQLLREVWGEAYADDSHLLRVNICNLRRKLEVDPVIPSYIKTEPGVGYRLAEPGQETIGRLAAR